MPAPDDPCSAPTRTRVAFGPFVLDPQRAALERDGQVVPLRRNAFDLLLALALRLGMP